MVAEGPTGSLPLQAPDGSRVRRGRPTAWPPPPRPAGRQGHQVAHHEHLGVTRAASSRVRPDPARPGRARAGGFCQRRPSGEARVPAAHTLVARRIRADCAVAGGDLTLSSSMPVTMAPRWISTPMRARSRAVMREHRVPMEPSRRPPPRPGRPAVDEGRCAGSCGAGPAAESSSAGRPSPRRSGPRRSPQTSARPARRRSSVSSLGHARTLRRCTAQVQGVVDALHARGVGVGIRRGRSRRSRRQRPRSGCRSATVAGWPNSRSWTVRASGRWRRPRPGPPPWSGSCGRRHGLPARSGPRRGCRWPPGRAGAGRGGDWCASMSVTRTGTRRSALAAKSPPNPDPMMTT